MGGSLCEVVFLSLAYLATVAGMGGKLVSETLLPPSRGVALIAFDTCLPVVRFSRACPYAHLPLAANSNAVS